MRKFLRGTFAACALALPLLAGAASPPKPFSADYEVRRNDQRIGTGQVSLQHKADGTFELVTRSKGTEGLAAADGERDGDAQRHHEQHEEQREPLGLESGGAPQQQQHAEGGAVEVGGALQVNLVALGRAVDALVGITKRLMGAEIKTPLNGNGQFLPVGGKLRANGHMALLLLL